MGVRAVESNSTVSTLFDFTQPLFDLIFLWTYWYKVLKTSLKNKNTIKSSSKTWWSAHAEAVPVLACEYEDSIDVLNTLCSDTVQIVETTFLTILWDAILKEMNKVNFTIQSQRMNLFTSSKFLKSLKS